ncbi:MAG: DUF6978 family protein [Suilimivivens sp.]
MTNQEFKKICELKKHFSDKTISLPAAGNKMHNPLVVFSDTTKDVFSLDIDRNGITLEKKKLQERHNNSNTVLIRLEIDCKPHMYADGHLSSRNHIHIFDEEAGTKTYDLTGEYGKLFPDTTNFLSIFYDFCSMCKIDTSDINVQGVI